MAKRMKMSGSHSRKVFHKTAGHNRVHSMNLMGGNAARRGGIRL